MRPDQITDYLGLAGDAVDNIPGVKGIGAKSAAELLARFGHLEELYERLDELPWLTDRPRRQVAPRQAGREPGDRLPLEAARDGRRGRCRA